MAPHARGGRRRFQRGRVTATERRPMVPDSPMVPDMEMPDGLTAIQCGILTAVRELNLELGHAPSMREVTDRLGRSSTGGLHYQYLQLAQKGYMRRHPRRPRTVEVRLPGESSFPSETDGLRPESAAPDAGEPSEPEKVIRVPIAGRIAAGDPIITGEPAGEEVRYLPLPKEVVGPEEGLFILEVDGDSMIGVGIFPGDYAVMRKLFQPPQNNDIVAATIDGVELEGTIKTYRKIGDEVWLMPHNAAYTPIPGGRAEC